MHGTFLLYVLIVSLQQQTNIKYKCVRDILETIPLLLSFNQYACVD